MSKTYFPVEPFKMERFIKILAEKSEATDSAVEDKLHSVYFDSYFRAVKPATMLVENEYTDRDFIEDHAGFYDRCFYAYKRKCTRVHFFRNTFSDTDFLRLLGGRTSPISHKKLQRAYLGFVVIKPLPKGIIGRTCLKTYPSLGGQRNFPIVRSYPVSLYGIDLSVRSLAFQEQDEVVAACATSALWSVFHGTGMLFGHPTPTPVEITKMATTLHSEAVPRSMPSSGLTCTQIIHAMLQLGLDPLRFNAEDPFYLMSTAYAYLRAGIPLLLTVALHDVSSEKKVRRYHFYRNKHAVAVTGYRLGRRSPEPVGTYEFKLRASRITKLYVHDDQVGPFARMVFDGKIIDVNGDLEGEKPRPMHSMRTSWRGGDGKIGHTRAIPEILLVPLYHKIRVDFKFVRSVIVEFDSLLKVQFFRRGLASLIADLEWDIFLTTVASLKAEYLSSSQIRPDEKAKLVTGDFPKYIWRCVLRRSGRVCFELLFDATDMNRGHYFLRAVPFDTKYYAHTVVVMGPQAQLSTMKSRTCLPILNWCATELKNGVSG